MSAYAGIMSRKHSATRPANVVAAWFKKFFARLYVSLHETQRKRANEIIQRHAHLTPQCDVNSDEQRKTNPSKESREDRKAWPQRY